MVAVSQRAMHIPIHHNNQKSNKSWIRLDRLWSRSASHIPASVLRRSSREARCAALEKTCGTFLGISRRNKGIYIDFKFDIPYFRTKGSLSVFNNLKSPERQIVSRDPGKFFRRIAVDV
jgi:hypothetical protein